MNVNGQRPSMLVILSHLFILYRHSMMMCGFVSLVFCFFFLFTVVFPSSALSSCIIIKNVLFIDSNKYLHTPNESNYGYFLPFHPLPPHIRTVSMCVCILLFFCCCPSFVRENVVQTIFHCPNECKRNIHLYSFSFEQTTTNT